MTFNFPDVCWSSLSRTSSLSNHFCEFVFDHNLTQHVTNPTHIMGNILDLVLTSAGISIIDLSVTPSLQHLSQGPKWFRSNIRHCLNCLRTLRRKYNSHPTLHTLLKIKSLEEHLQTEISSAKSAFESNLLMLLKSNDCIKVYSYIRSVTGQNTIPRCLMSLPLTHNAGHSTSWPRGSEPT